MATLSHVQARKVLKTAWFTPSLGERWGLPLLLIGDPGTGKSSQITAEARALGLQAKTLIGSVYDPTDFGGIPTAAQDGGRFAQALLPGWLREVDSWGAAGVLVLDELTCVPAAVQAAMLRLVLEGAVGDYRLDPRVRIVAAANPPEQAAGGQGLSMPMANRFGHLTVEPPALDAWFDILAGEFYGEAPVDAAAVEAEVLAQWPQAYARAQALAKAFLRKFPTYAQTTPAAGSAESEGAWTSRRTWELAIRAVAGAAIHGCDTDERDTLIEAFLGTATARAWASWLAQSDVPDAAEVLDGVRDWAPVAHRPDITQAVLDSCVALVLKGTTQPAHKVARARALWRLLSTLTDAPDLALHPIARLSTDTSLIALPEAAAARRAVQGVSYAVGLGGLRR